jgi:predicted nucleotidyltransferase component of viral defense system
MIGLIELRERAVEWSLRDDVVEKDYALGWLLWGIGSHPALASAWVFKGGTCLKKCYFETYRFSEDLDFTVIGDGPRDPEELKGLFGEIADRVYEASGIEIPREQIRFEQYKTRRGSTAVEGRVYYRGPRRPGGDLPRVKIDLTADEVLVDSPILRGIAHPYTDEFPDPPRVTAYSLPEIFGEKLRALAERCLPRDLYDVIHLYRRVDLRGTPDVVRRILTEKCRYKEIPVPTVATIEAGPRRAELEAEWQHMLGHQLPELPPPEVFLAELRELFAWLEGQPVEVPVLPAFPLAAEAAPGWAPPATVATWGRGVPLEAIRFAGVNRLCVDLGYQGSVRRIEPYSLRRTQDGNIVLHAVRRDTREPRSYRIDRIESVRVTKEPFVPAYPIEFWPMGTLEVAPAPPRRASVRATTPRRAMSTGPRYVVQCSYCGKQFTRRDTNLAKHKMKGNAGFDCPGRVGFIVRMA